jgi:hypothetical protein
MAGNMHCLKWLAADADAIMYQCHAQIKLALEIQVTQIAPH